MSDGTGDVLAARIVWARGLGATLALTCRLLHLRDDLAAIAAAAALAAHGRFDAAQGAPFEAFAYPRVIGALARAIRRERRHMFAISSVGPEMIDDAVGRKTSSALAALEDLAEDWMDRVCDPASAGADSEALLVAHEEHDALRSGIERLAAEDRRLIELRDLDELPWKEVAARLGIPERTAKDRHLRVRELLRNMLQK